MFSDQAAVIQEIVRLHEDPEGFLVQVHSQLSFDQQLFDHCVDVVEQYHALVKTDRLIDKRVVRFLCDTVTTLEGSADQFYQLQHPSAGHVSDACLRWLSLIDQLLAIEPADPNADTASQLTLL